jgi:hypothetical protein
MPAERFHHLVGDTGRCGRHRLGVLQDQPFHLAEDVAVPPVRGGADLRRGHGVIHRGLPVPEVHAPGAADRGRHGHDGKVLEPAVKLVPPLHLQFEDCVRTPHLHVVPDGAPGSSMTPYLRRENRAPSRYPSVRGGSGEMRAMTAAPRRRLWVPLPRHLPAPERDTRRERVRGSADRRIFISEATVKTHLPHTLAAAGQSSASPLLLLSEDHPRLPCGCTGPGWLRGPGRATWA